MPSVQLAFRVDPAFAAQLERIAKERNTTLSQLLRDSAANLVADTDITPNVRLYDATSPRPIRLHADDIEAAARRVAELLRPATATSGTTL